MDKTKKNKIPVTSYQLFIFLLSILSIVNIFLYLFFATKSILYVIGIIDVFLSIIFFIDFCINIVKADSKFKYFFKQFGWADLLASIPIPQFKILRLFRIIKTIKIVRQHGSRVIAKGIFKNTASSALYLVMFIIILLLEFGSIAVLSAESTNSAANITTASDAIWWVYVTITTVGYGDKYPITNVGRIIGMIVMFVGVGLFGVLTGFLANKFLPKDDELYSKIDLLHEEIVKLKDAQRKD